MPRSILCQKCGVVLKLPAAVSAGKRMKCPKCGHKFAISEKAASSDSTMAGVADADLASSRDLGKRPPSHDNLPVPAGDKDLHDLFDLPLETAASIEKSAISQKPVVSDAESLFQESTVRKKKSTGAEAGARLAAA